MGNFTIRINHLTQTKFVMLLVNAECLKSVSAAFEYLTVPKTPCSDHFLGAALLTTAVTSLLFAQPHAAEHQSPQHSLKCGGMSGNEV